jgi:mRNA interferase RelE/StbE
MEITLSKRAAKALATLNNPLQSRIMEGIYKLPAGDIKKLKGYVAAFRLRIGDYRILFEMTTDEIYISDILPRGEAYKK